MRKSLSQGKKPDGEGKKVSWKRRPSEIRGYQAALYTTTDGGDYLRVDYNLKDRKIRIYIEDAEEGGNPYYAVFTGGRVSAQRNVTTGRAHQVVEKLKLRADAIRTISNKEVRKIVTGALKLDDAPLPEKPAQDESRKEALDRTRKRYFRPVEARPWASVSGGAITARSFFRGLLDYTVGILLVVAILLYFRDFIAAGVTAAFFGIFIGIIELFLRGRDPSIIKMLFFVCAGAALYVYGYYFL